MSEDKDIEVINPASNITIAVLDDDSTLCRYIVKVLMRGGFNVTGFTDSDKCLEHCKENSPDIAIVDLVMPKQDGFSILEQIKSMGLGTDVIIITGFAEKKIALEALRLGAFDLLEKPFDDLHLIETIKRTVKYKSALKEINRISRQLSTISEREAERWGIKALIGTSGAITNIVGDIRLLQKAENTPVLVTGESGTGKELVARAIHFGSGRSANPFIPVNCAAIPRELAESLLFGHVKGSFSGAVTDQKGVFVNADGGSVFLDEIGDMPYELQAKLLRIIEDGVVYPVGGAKGKKVNVRAIAATNCDLKNKIRDKTFREDLFYRISAYSIKIPALRERKEDIPSLIEYFMERLCREMNIKKAVIDPEVMKTIQTYAFPGNVRELKNMVERVLITKKDEALTAEDFVRFEADHHASSGDKAADDVPLNLREAEKYLIKRALDKTKGNISAAATLLGISRARLYRKIPS